MADLGYDDKVAIITGAGGGLGREHALLLASRGARSGRLHPGVGEGLRPVTHSITRYRIRLEIFRATVARPPSGLAPAGEWHDRAGLERLALTAAHRRIARQLA